MKQNPMIKFKEKITPITRDEQGLLVGGFVNVDTNSVTTGGTNKNKKCTNQNCSIDKNVDLCKNTNCVCLCDENGNSGGGVIPSNPCSVILPNNCL